MAWVNRLASIFPGMGLPFQNDSVFQSVGNALTTGNTTTLSSLSPTLSRGKVRVKVYGASGTTPSLLTMYIALSDGKDFVQIFNWAPGVAMSLDVTPAGTQLATDGAMGAGLKVLTSASNPFTPAMVGATIAVSKAGNAGGTLPLYTTVASYQSSGQVTLAAATVQTGGTSSATITLTESYLNGGTAAAPAGFDIVVPFCVDINVSRIDVVTTGAGTSVMDLEIAGTT